MENNPLHQKTIVWDGDSICQGTGNFGNWATRIAERNEMRCSNYAVGGGTVTEDPPRSRSGERRHSLSETLERIGLEVPDADYVIFEGGTNDADLLGDAAGGEEPNRLGGFTADDFSGTYDTKTFCGALEDLFFRALRIFNGKKIGFLIAPKMGMEKESFRNRRLYFDCAAAICEKWGIPYLDLWKGCELNPYLPWMYDPQKSPEENKTENSGYYIDGQHLTARGYDRTVPLIETWLKTL